MKIATAITATIATTVDFFAALAKFITAIITFAKTLGKRLFHKSSLLCYKIILKFFILYS